MGRGIYGKDKRRIEMKVIFYPDDIDSDIINVPNDITEDELSDMACEWVADNVQGFWKVIEEGEQE